MDTTPSRLRCASPQTTACSTHRKTVSQVEWKRLATSRHDSTFAQLARKPGERVGRLHLACRPRHRLDGDAAAPALDPAHGVHQEHGQSPERYEAEEARVEHVVARPLLEAGRADATPPSTWANVDPERRAGSRALPAHLLVDETGRRVEAAQDRFDVHRVGCRGLNNLASRTMHPSLARPRRPPMASRTQRRESAATRAAHADRTPTDLAEEPQK